LQRRKLVVAIDGPSGSGKSTVAREVAIALGLRYLDTGAMYRAVTWLALRSSIDLTSAADLSRLAEGADLQVSADPTEPTIRAGGTDVTNEVRSARVTAAVSTVSAVAGVRSEMVRRQRAIIGEGGIVVEGRDIGTTVAPDAPVKVFLTASAEMRAQRRSRQDGTAAGAVADTEAALRRRDEADSTRTASPMHQAPDAVVLDSSALDVGQVVAAVLARARAVVVA
jgi:CMP/dCMP kinase